VLQGDRLIPYHGTWALGGRKVHFRMSSNIAQLVWQCATYLICREIDGAKKPQASSSCTVDGTKINRGYSFLSIGQKVQKDNTFQSQHSWGR
jgi:hypothetical protein